MVLLLRNISYTFSTCRCHCVIIWIEKRHMASICVSVDKLQGFQHFAEGFSGFSLLLLFLLASPLNPPPPTPADPLCRPSSQYFLMRSVSFSVTSSIFCPDMGGGGGERRSHLGISPKQNVPFCSAKFICIKDVLRRCFFLVQLNNVEVFIQLSASPFDHQVSLGSFSKRTFNILSHHHFASFAALEFEL